MLKRAAFALAASFLLASPAMAKPPLEAFGDLPTVRSPDLSPDGKYVAYISRVNGMDHLARYDVATGKNEVLIRIPDVQANSTFWIGSNYIILRASRFMTNNSLRLKYEDTAAFAYNVATGKITHLLVGSKDLYRYQLGLGNIVAIDPDGRHVYMPAFMNRRRDEPVYEVLKVSLDTGMGEGVSAWKPTLSTARWVLDDNAQAIARVDFNAKRSWHEIATPDGKGGWRVIFKESAEEPSINVVGLSRKPGTLIVAKGGDSDYMQLHEMSLTDGALSAPLHGRTDREIEGLMRDQDNVVFGVAYSGIYPSYTFDDETLTRDIRAASAALPDAAVSIASWTDDRSKFLLHVDGGKDPPRYMLYDRAARSMTSVARTRPEIGTDDVGEVVTVEYKARDDLVIPSLITWPAGLPADQRKNLPLIVMPHGGPESYDAVSFDWMAQFFANEGYVVLQPNFRGSGGFGPTFTAAGYGEWGRKMQDDVTDGVNALVTMGWADPKRVCIVGWSYGGYSALAGGALTPDLYKCVVSIAGVSDLRTMLAEERKQNGVNSSSYRYWTSVIGDPAKEGDAIEAASPYRLAKNFTAPVLLIHGSNDLVVPDSQSDMMEKALNEAGKPVTYLRIGKDDHGLVAPESRTKALTAIRDFVSQHIGK